MPQNTITVPIAALTPTPPPQTITVPLAALQPAAAPERTWGDTASDLAIGAVKGVGNTVYGLGKIVHDYTPIGRISDAIQPHAFDVKPPELTPTNTPQAIGMGAEQVGEFFLPTGAVGKIGKAAEVAKAGALTLAQSGSPATAGVSAALTAVIPGGGAAKKVAGALEESANKSMAQALGATKEWAKTEAAKLAPQLIKRGIGGSRAEMYELAAETTKRIGKELDTAYAAAAAAGETVPSAIIQGNMQVAADALKVATPSGAMVAIPGTERVIRQLDKLQRFTASLGDDIPVDKAAKIKKVWDRVVSKAGLYGKKAASSATDDADAWALREAAGSYRELLNKNATVAELNKELEFWIPLRKVLKETTERVQAQSGGIVAVGMGGSGAIIGAMSGDTASDKAMKAVIGGIAGRKAVQMLQSPAFRTQIAGPLKQQLADALASGVAGRVASVVQRIIASAPSEVRQQFASE